MRDHVNCRLTAALVASCAVAGAVPAVASADAAETALGAPLVRASVNIVPAGTNTANYVVECTAVSVSPAASTRVQCTAGPASAGITLPGQVATAVGVGTGPLFASSIQVCASATTRLATGGTESSGGCWTNVGLTAALVGG